MRREVWLSAAAGWARRYWGALAAAALVAVAVAVRVVLSRRVAAPVVLCDEFIYANIAKNLAQHGQYLFRGVPLHQSYAYPLVIAPAWLFKSMGTTYAVAKAITAVAMVLSAVPVYLWGRRLVPPLYALLAAVLTLLLPAFFYSALLMTEGLFLPAFLLAVFAIALMLERPTLVFQVGALVAIAVAVSVRVQGIVLFLAVPTAVALKLLLDWRAGARQPQLAAYVRQLWPTAALLVTGAVGYAVYKLARGEPLSSGLGPYQGLAEKHYQPLEVARWSIKHLAELTLAVGLVPLSALIVLLWVACRRAPTTSAERAFLAVVPAVMLWVLLAAGAFAEGTTGFIFERYTFYVAPLLLLAFVLWLRRGLPRPSIGTVVALGTPILLLALLEPAATIVGDPVNGITVDALYRFSLHLPGGLEELKWAVAAGALLASFLFALSARSLARVALPVLLVAYLAAASKPAFSDVRAASLDTRAAAGPDPSWVVEAIGESRPALFLNAPSSALTPPSNVLLETEFWNPNVAGVYSVGASEICGLTETATTVDPASGRIVPPLPPGTHHAVIFRDVPIDGTVVATGGPSDARLALYRTEESIRLGRLVTGVYADGWMGSEASYSVYASSRRGAGTVVVTVGRTGWSGPDVPGRVAIRVGRPAAKGGGIGKQFAERRWVVHRLAQRTFAFADVSPPLRVEVTVDPTFSPAQFGGADARQLGAQASFQYVPRRVRANAAAPGASARIAQSRASATAFGGSGASGRSRPRSGE